MDYKNINGIILTSRKYKENQSILKLFTRELGLITILNKSSIKANTSGRSMNHFCSEGLYTLAKGKNFYYIKDFDLINGNLFLRQSFEAYIYINLIANIINITMLENIVEPKIYDLFNKTILMMKKRKENSLMYLNGFLIKFITYLGYKPNLRVSSLKKKNYYFSFSTGGIFENNVETQQGINLTKENLLYLRFILITPYENFKDIFPKKTSIDIFNFLILYLKYLFEIQTLSALNLVDSYHSNKL